MDVNSDIELEHCGRQSSSAADGGDRKLQERGAVTGNGPQSDPIFTHPAT